MDFFDILLAKKLEDDRDPTIEGLSVTENGTYSEEGKAYNPVVVNVPEPTLITKTITANGTYTAGDDNADGYSSVTVAVEGFKKKSIANTPTDIASFDDGTANPMTSLKISIEPVQSGSGDPSPSNVRPISGWNGAQITVTNDLTTPTETHTTSILFRDSSDNPITVYGGRLNVTSGELTVDMVSIDLSSISAFSSDAVNDNGFIRYNCVVSGKVSNFNLLCSMLKVLSTVVSSNTNTEEISGSSTNNRFYFSINADRLSGDLSTTAGRNSALKDWLTSNDIQVVYELETPQIYQLTSVQVTLLLDKNNIFADCGQILEGEYFATL